MNNLDADDLIMIDEDGYFKCILNMKVDFRVGGGIFRS